MARFSVRMGPVAIVKHDVKDGEVWTTTFWGNDGGYYDNMEQADVAGLQNMATEFLKQLSAVGLDIAGGKGAPGKARTPGG